MIKIDEDYEFANVFFEELFINFSNILAQKFISDDLSKKINQMDYTYEINEVIFWTSEILNLATKLSPGKFLGSVSKNGTGDKSMSQLKIIPLLNINHIDSSFFDEHSYFYSLQRSSAINKWKHQHPINSKELGKIIESINTDELKMNFDQQTKQSISKIIMNWSDNEKNALFGKYDAFTEEEFLSQFPNDAINDTLNQLNDMASKINTDICEYNNQILDFKKEIIALKKDKSFIFLAFRIDMMFSLLPIDKEGYSYVDLVKECFKYSESLDSLPKIDILRSNYIISNLPSTFKPCVFEELCNPCKCPEQNGFKKCLNPPRCKNCDYTKSVVEIDAHHDDPFGGFEFYDGSDFCYSILGYRSIKKKLPGVLKKMKKTKRKNVSKKTKIDNSNEPVLIIGKQ